MSNNDTSNNQNNDLVKTVIEYCLKKLNPASAALIIIVVVFLRHPNPPPPHKSPVYSLSDYQRLTLGMSQIQVESILGGGTETDQLKTTTTFEWRNEDGSLIVAKFENRKLQSKHQSNLE